MSLKFRQPLIPRALAAIAVVVGAGFANACLGAAIVGETRRVEIARKPAQGLETMKSEYRRPDFIPFPKYNPFTLEKVSLGKILYFDTRLSATSAQSCASCHSPGFGWGDGLSLGVGQGMMKLGRRSPSIVNAAWGEVFMWDGRAASLEEQALGPIQSPAEMNMPIELLMNRLASISGYERLFAAAFPGEGITPKTLANAIATYERTVVSDRAPFDDWIDGGERAISEDAKRGFVVFNTKDVARRATRVGISAMKVSTISASRARMSAADSS